MIIRPNIFSPGVCVKWNITSPDEYMFDWTKYYNLAAKHEIGRDEQSLLSSKYFKKNKQRMLDIWDKVFTDENIRIDYSRVIRNMIQHNCDFTGSEKFTFTIFTEGPDIISKTIQNRLNREAQENGDKIKQFHYALGYIRHKTNRVPYRPFTQIEVLFGDGDKDIYYIYKRYQQGHSALTWNK